MKMAKASQADLDTAQAIAQALGDMFGTWNSFMPSKGDDASTSDEPEQFDIDNPDDCMEALQRLKAIHARGCLFRVAAGMVVLLDPRNNVVDPDLDHLELHPLHRAAKGMPPLAGLTEAQQCDLATAVGRALGTWEDRPEWLVKWHDSVTGVPAPAERPVALEGGA